MSLLLEAEIWLQEPTRFEYRDGCFHLSDRISAACEIRRCYSVHNFLASMRAANDALAAWQSEQREVVLLESRKIG